VTHRARVLALVLGGAWVATPAWAQTPPAAPPPVTIAITVGPLSLGDLQTQPVMVERLDEEGMVADAATIDRVIRMGRGFRANASAAVALGPSWSVRMGGTVGRARLGQAFTGAEEWVVEAAGIPMEGDAGVSVVGLESALRFRIPTGHLFRPYLEVGVSAERWRGGAGPWPGAEALVEPLARFGGHAALGGDYPLADRLAVRVQTSTRFQRTILVPMPPGSELARTDMVVMTAQSPGVRPFADAAIEQLMAVRLELGLSYALGGTAAPPRDPPESDESTSSPPR
jgi:hypothetical protein